VIGGLGAAIVSVEHRGRMLLVEAIERLPFDLSPVVDRVLSLPHEARRDSITIDASGLGMALWAAIGSPDHRRGWRLVTARGLERQALVDRLVLAIHHDRLRFAPALAEQDVMTRALAGYRREVRDDGQVGSELVVALCLALIEPRIARPRIY
jgi:hypothetical protein